MEMQAGPHSKPAILIHGSMWELYRHFLYKVDMGATKVRPHLLPGLNPSSFSTEQ